MTAMMEGRAAGATPKKPTTIEGTLDRLCRDAKRLCGNEYLFTTRLVHEVPHMGPRGERLGVRVTVSVEVLEAEGGR